MSDYIMAQFTLPLPRPEEEINAIRLRLPPGQAITPEMTVTPYVISVELLGGEIARAEEVMTGWMKTLGARIDEGAVGLVDAAGTAGRVMAVSETLRSIVGENRRIQINTLMHVVDIAVRHEPEGRD